MLKNDISKLDFKKRTNVEQMQINKNKFLRWLNVRKIF